MVRLIHQIGISWAVLSYLIASVAMATPPSFSAQSLENLGIEGMPLRINDKGQILFVLDRLGYLYTPESGVILVPTPDPNTTDVFHPIELTFDDLNNDGEVAGSVALFSGNFLLSKRAFIFSESDGLEYVSELLNSDKEIHRIFATNDVGDIFGSEIITQSMGGIEKSESFLFTTQDGFIDLGLDLRPLDMNNQRQAVGRFFWYSPNEGVVGIEGFSGRSINNLGQAVGSLSFPQMPSSAAVYTRSDGAQFLPTLTGELDNSTVGGINDNGWMLGLGRVDQDGLVPTLIIGNEIWELDALVSDLDPAEFSTVFDGIDINNNGEILAEGLSGEGERFKYLLLTPELDNTQYFALEAVHSGRVFDVAQASTEDGAKVIQWPWFGGDHQQWAIKYEEGAYRLIAKHSGLCLSIEPRNRRLVSRILQRKCIDNDSQAWQLTRDNRGFELQSLLNGQCVDIIFASNRNGARAIGWFCHGGDNQRFVIDGFEADTTPI